MHGTSQDLLEYGQVCRICKESYDITSPKYNDEEEEFDDKNYTYPFTQYHPDVAKELLIKDIKKKKYDVCSDSCVETAEHISR